MRTYLDWNASAPLRTQAREALFSALERFGNPSSIHREGREAKELLENSREEVAAFMGCAPKEVVFTSGGAEGNNLAIASFALAAKKRAFAVSKLEHPSVLCRLEKLEASGWKGNWLPVSQDGVIDIDRLTGEEGLVCLQAANQETGAHQKIGELGEKCAALSIPFHCDGVQRWGKSPLGVREAGCSTASLSGHKIGAPKGTGALYVKSGVEIEPLIMGGSQERSRRGGTENVPGIAALAAACRAAKSDLQGFSERCRVFYDLMAGEVLRLYPKAAVNGPSSPEKRLPNTLNLSFPGLTGATLVPALDLEGVAVSAGSACSSGAVKPSPVLLAMGLGEANALGSLRVSMGWTTTKEDIERFLKALELVLSRMVF
ncbi:cysteine desulfurase [bacterium]|nr:MAG: cysteine desulfurase [bacterium]